MKTCCQCGEQKSLSEFRHYYGGRKGTYRYCKTCEKIMMRKRYLDSKRDSLTDSEKEELAKIEKLYSIRESIGLEVPGKRPIQATTSDIVDMLLEKTQG